MTPEPDYLPLIRRLAEIDPPGFVFGGFAEDALLDGRVTRPHGDVDLLVDRVELTKHLERFAAWGFPEFEVFFEVVPGSPLVLGSSHEGLDLELGLLDETSDRRPSFVVPKDDGLVRVTLPADTLHHPVGTIDGVPIRTISPLALYQMRSAFVRSGAFGPPRPKDLSVQARLREGPLAGLQDAALEPPLEPYELPSG